MSKIFAIGDIHTNFKALEQVLEKSHFNYEEDTLIQLGDIVDGGTQDTYLCVEELLKIKNLILIKGNHDDWFLRWLTTGEHPDSWIQGGYNTAASYPKYLKLDKQLWGAKWKGYSTTLTPEDIPVTHHNFFRSQKLYHIIEDKLFLHGGYDRNTYVVEEAKKYPSSFYWDRELVQAAMSCTGDQKLKTKDNFNEIFLGHTTTMIWGTTEPIYRGGVWNLDTGAAEGKGKLTIMNINTHEYWQSDTTKELYPDFKPR
jgi:serine/threonine protein phosphatase 1